MIYIYIYDIDIEYIEYIYIFIYIVIYIYKLLCQLFPLVITRTYFLKDTQTHTFVNVYIHKSFCACGFCGHSFHNRFRLVSCLKRRIL